MLLSNSTSPTRMLPSVGAAILVPAIVLVTWELTVRSGWLPFQLIAAPTTVASRFVRMLVSGELPIHAWVSLRRLLLGFGLGAITGVLMGTGVGLSKRMEAVVAPTLRFLSPVPPIAWIPLLIIALGIGEASKVLLVAIGVFFVVSFSTIEGIRGTDNALVDVGRVYEKRWYETTLCILLPAAMPSIFSGLRVAMALSWILLIAAEVIASSRGLGWLIWDSRNFSRPDDMLVGVIAVGVLGKLTDQLLAMAQTWVLRWRQTYKGA